MNGIIKALKIWSNKYQFSSSITGNSIFIRAKTIDKAYVSWLIYNCEKDTYRITGNTDFLNVWLNETRPDLTDVILYEAITELAGILEANTQELFQSLVDPEDWQVIAGIQDARTDERYYKEG